MRLHTTLLLSLFLVAAVLACDFGPTSEDLPTPRPRAAAVSTAPARPAPAEDDTPLPAGTPADVPAVVGAIQAALNAGDSSGLRPLLLDTVVLAQGPNGEAGQQIGREAALKWLNDRWGRRRSVASSQYVEHFVLLEVATQGWAALPPLRTGSLMFHLHRFTAGGDSDPVSGSWRIDTILYP